MTYCAQTIRGVWALYEHVIDQDPFPRDRRALPVVSLPSVWRVASPTFSASASSADSTSTQRSADHSASTTWMQLFFAVGETGASYLVLDSQRRAFSDRDRAVLDLLAHTSRSSGSDTAASPTLQLRLRPRLRFSALASRNPRPLRLGHDEP